MVDGVKRAYERLLTGAGQVMRTLLAPFGFLAFLIAVGSLSACARLLGGDHALGGFAGRLAESIRRYPEVTRRGVRFAWILWGSALILALSPLDPIATWWDEIVLVAIAAGLLWHRLFSKPDRSARS